MFCIKDSGEDAQHHAHHSRTLRSFRSHKSLKSSSRSQDMHSHQRWQSDASSLARSSTESARPSTGRTDKSVDWDPLRLHPPLATGHTPQFGTHSRHHHDDDDNHNHQHESDVRQIRSLHDMRAHQAHYGRAGLHAHSASSSSTTVIYGGFDFGFQQNAAGSRARREPMQMRHGDPWPSPTPSDCSTSSGAGSEFDTAPSGSQAPGWGDAVTPRPHPAGMDSADYFLKRGGWKRRGIVFTPEVPMATQDECFDLEME
ncbi:hypothetical protein B0T22DRAFT_452963 [Podospora appendiculata]|uniref:Uncharacterized protein n=1 Tax=Podospora appendiculata TaxID=314037 RepID=A0AAE0XJF3_9PEZI|nr:hypothetical protein B0T22DRAFT_452963 [Podospora appendiculata]